MVQLVTQTLSLLESYIVEFIHSVLHLVIKSPSLGALRALFHFSEPEDTIVHKGYPRANGAERQLPQPKQQGVICVMAAQRTEATVKESFPDEGTFELSFKGCGINWVKKGKYVQAKDVLKRNETTAQFKHTVVPSGRRKGCVYVGFGSDEQSIRKQRTPI